jgi:glycosyltransferase involved in cell wall biosynthesis
VATRLNRAARRLVRRWGGRPLVRYRRRRLAPVVTVVMPVFDVVEYLPAALDSVLGQSLGNLELIAVDDGSTDGCLEVLRRYERRDHRVLVLTQPHAGQGPARNLGVARARGEFLAFVDADDVVPPRAFAHMVDRLQRSGSDFCVGSVRRFRNEEYRRMIWARTVHDRDRLGTTLEEFPNAMQDIIACNRMFRTAFWRDRVGGFRGGVVYEDHVPMLTAYLRAAKFDVLREVTYDWRIRENRTSTSQYKGNLRNLLDRVEVKDEALALLDAEASDLVRDLWIGRTLDVDFPPFVAHALVGDEEYRATLAATYRKFLDLASDRALEQVTVRQKIRAELVAAGRWDEVAQVNAWFDDIGMVPPTTVVDGAVTAVMPAELGFLAELPARVLRLSALDCHFEGVTQHVDWADGTVRVDGWAYLRGLAITGRSASFRAWLVGDDGERLDVVTIEPVLLPEANIWSRQPFAPYDGAGFVATVALAALPHRRGRWSLHVRVEYDGVSGSGPLLERVHESAATRSTGAPHPAGGVVRTEWSPADGFGLVVDPAGVVEHPDGLPVAGVELGAGTLAVALATGPAGDPDDAAARRLVLRCGDVRLGQVGAVRTDDGWRLDFALRVDGRVAPRGRYVLEGARRPVPAPAYLGRMPHRLYGPDVDVKVGVGPDGLLHLDLQPPLPPDALGAPNRRRLRDAWRAAAPAPTDAVLLWSGHGAAPDGALLDLDRALATSRPDLVRRWVVADRSVPVPDGAQAVLADSPEWYDVLASSRYLCGDAELDPFFAPKQHQRSLRVLALRPGEPVGLERWRAEGMSEQELQRELRRVRQQWHTVLAPDEATAAVCRDQLGWAGPVLVATAEQVVASFFTAEDR